MAGEITTIRPNGYQRFIHRFLMIKWVSTFLARILHRVDHFVLTITKGHVTATQVVGLPIIELTTTGAKTGQPRTTPLVSLPDGERIVLIASNFGKKHNPGWYHNLKVHPECVAKYAGQHRIYLAREVHATEWEKYFQLANSYYGGYERYRERAAPRQIPVMVLEPKK